MTAELPSPALAGGEIVIYRLEIQVKNSSVYSNLNDTLQYGAIMVTPFNTYASQSPWKP